MKEEAALIPAERHAVAEALAWLAWSYARHPKSEGVRSSGSGKERGPSSVTRNVRASRHRQSNRGKTRTNMRSVNDVEAYLGKMNRSYAPVDDQPGTFLVHGNSNMPPTALRVDPPLVVLRVHVGDVEGQSGDNAELFRKLLTLNAKALVHTSFGLEESRIVLSSALELENLDYNELQATLDEIDVTLAQQVATLAELSKAASVRPAASSGSSAKGSA